MALRALAALLLAVTGRVRALPIAASSTTARTALAAAVTPQDYEHDDDAPSVIVQSGFVEFEDFIVQKNASGDLIISGLGSLGVQYDHLLGEHCRARNPDIPIINASNATYTSNNGGPNGTIGQVIRTLCREHLDTLARELAAERNIPSPPSPPPPPPGVPAPIIYELVGEVLVAGAAESIPPQDIINFQNAMAETAGVPPSLVKPRLTTAPPGNQSLLYGTIWFPDEATFQVGRRRVVSAFFSPGGPEALGERTGFAIKAVGRLYNVLTPQGGIPTITHLSPCSVDLASSDPLSRRPDDAIDLSAMPLMDADEGNGGWDWLRERVRGAIVLLGGDSAWVAPPNPKPPHNRHAVPCDGTAKVKGDLKPMRRSSTAIPQAKLADWRHAPIDIF